MNKKQKEFLEELRMLCYKYHIDTMFGSNKYVEISFSNCELLAFRNYVKGEFIGIWTSVYDYEVGAWNTRYPDSPSEINENAPNSGENNSSE